MTRFLTYVRAICAVALMKNVGAQTYDVIVYGSTPGGITSAIAASDGGKNSVLLIEPLLFIGGMGSAGGLGLNDQQVTAPVGAAPSYPIISGLARTWCNLNGLHYTPNNASNCVHHPDNYVSEASFLTMLKQAGVTTVTGCMATGTTRSTTDPLVIASVTVDCTDGGGGLATYIPRHMVIDASYDGDLMVADRGIDYTWGRESNSSYGEPMAGLVYAQETGESFSAIHNVSAVDAQGNLLPGIEAGTPSPAGSGDDRLMAFQHRACVTTDKGNMVPFSPPPGYNRSDFALLQAVVDAEIAKGYVPTPSYFGLSGPYAPAVAAAGRHKVIVCCGAAAVMSDEPNLNRGWANASWPQRKAMMDAHRYWLGGMLYYLANDPAVPASVRGQMAQWGLCADEWTTAQPPHWPPQLYVRVSNRLVGDFVLTQLNMLNPRTKGNSVSMALWELDSHITSRWAVPNPNPGPGLPAVIPLNEGYFRHSANVSLGPEEYCGTTDGQCDPTQLWFDVPFAVMLPKRTQASNLLVPVALSASAVAYTAARIETMFMDLGTAAGVAAGLVMAAGGPSVLAVQDVNVTAVQATLVGTYGQRTHGPWY